MKFTPLLARLFVLITTCSSLVAAPYPPEGRLTRHTQPGGAVLELRVFGDEFHARTENLAGYTVVLNAAEQAYYHAVLSADGTSLIPSSIPANEPAPAGSLPHLDLPEPRIREIIAQRRSKLDSGRAARWSERVRDTRLRREAAARPSKRAPLAPAAAPVIGAKRGLTVLVQFPNDPQTSNADPVNFPTSQEKIVRLCNAVGYKDNGNTGSVRDYFFDQSLGRLTYTQTVTPIVTLPKSRAYYNFSDYPKNKTFRDDASRVLLTDALAVLVSQGFDFSGLTTDDNNRAVATNVFFAGADSGVYAQGLWPQSWSLQSPVSVGPAGSTILISNFQITNIEDSAPVIGTFCHENGHMLLDYPDIYAFNGEGVGEHCLMGSGNYSNNGKTPSPINGHFKDLVGWGNVIELAASETRVISLPTTGNVACRIRKADAPTESFLIENRGQGDRWAANVPDKGIAIWHIDETVDGNLSRSIHYGVALEQADGLGELELGRGRGDGDDLFDLSRPSFTDAGKPSALWWNGQKSFVRVEVRSAPGENTNVLFSSLAPETILVDSPNGGETIFPGTDRSLAWRASISGNVKIELLRPSFPTVVISPNETNDGLFSWAVPSSLPAGDDYSLRISSVNNPATSDESDAPFSIDRTTFPLGNVMPYGWFKPKKSATAWKVSASAAYEGTHSLGSLDPGDGGRSAIAYRSNFKAGSISFYLRVSSEKDFDVARFYINGQPQNLGTVDSLTKLSGKTDWVAATFQVPAGVHTFMWTYEKDDSYAGLKDGAWVDGVSLPDTREDIAVTDAAGKDLVSGEASSSFSASPIGTLGESRQFTITNRGQSDLHGLRIIMIGGASGDFSARNLGKKALRPGTSTTFDVDFIPTAMGSREATLQILSSDADQPVFAIDMAGSGLGVPALGVTVKGDTLLSNGKKSVSFGSQTVGKSGKTKTFTVTNTGSAVLSDLSLTRSGRGKADFRIDPVTVTTLLPGESTRFAVAFHPKSPGLRELELVLASSSKGAAPFRIQLSGQGKGGKLDRRSTLANISRPEKPGLPGAAHISVEVIGGEKFRSLTIAKSPGTMRPPSIEVSPDLLEWFSGKNHTTTLIDTATTLKVRDNTPLTSGVKRFIRVK